MHINIPASLLTVGNRLHGSRTSSGLLARSFHHNVLKPRRNSSENQDATRAHIANQSVTEEQRRLSLEEPVDSARYGEMFVLEWKQAFVDVWSAHILLRS